jgi:endoribonuclease LACTB2
MGTVSEPTVEALYEQVCGLLPAAEEEVPATPVPVAPGIRVLALRSPTLPPAAHTNVYLVGPEAGPVAVIDPGSPYPDQQALLDRALADAAPAAVLLTHHHGDHIGGAVALARRWSNPIAAHAATARRLAGRVEVNRTIEDGETAYGATAIFTPGHAEGHLCYAVGDATIAGDMVAGLGTILIDPAEGDMAVYLASGHGKLREYLAHRRKRESKVAAALHARPRALAELVAEAYDDTPSKLWGLAERSLLAHLVKLARERRATDAGGGRWSR